MISQPADALDKQLDSYCAVSQRRARSSTPDQTASRTNWKRFAAAAGASLAGATAADAAINLVEPPNPIRAQIPFDAFSEFQFIDIDGDSVDDLRLGAVVDTAYPSFSGYRYFGLAEGLNGLTPIGNGGEIGAIRRFDASAVIPAVTPASVGTIVRASATSFGNIASTQGEWSFSDTGFAGFVFGPGGSKRAGWIQIRTESFNNQGTERMLAVEVIKWAYETVPGMSIMAGQTSSVAIPGDYNNNGSVGPEDYDKWKNDFGDSVIAGTGADGNANAKVDAADYTVWRDNLGAGTSGGSALAGAVPEPSTVTLGVLALGAAGIAALRRRST